MRWYDLVTAQYYIPRIITEARLFSNGTMTGVLVKYSFDPRLYKTLLFFIHLYDNPNESIHYDSFNFIPLTREEIVGLKVLCDDLDTILKGKITTSYYHVLYTP
jgi:hypothetical protein